MDIVNTSYSWHLKFKISCVRDSQRQTKKEIQFKNLRFGIVIS